MPNTLTTTDKYYTTAVVRALCSKCCTFSVQTGNSTFVGHPFIGDGKPADRFKAYNHWLPGTKCNNNSTFIITIHEDLSGQAGKVLHLAHTTQTLIG